MADETSENPLQNYEDMLKKSSTGIQSGRSNSNKQHVEENGVVEVSETKEIQDLTLCISAMVALNEKLYTTKEDNDKIVDKETKPDEDSPNTHTTENGQSPRMIREGRYLNCNGDTNNLIHKENHVEPFIYKPTSTPTNSPQFFRRRKRDVSMFEMQPSTAQDVLEIQEICIERGGAKAVRKSEGVLPELSSGSKVDETRGMSSKRRQLADMASGSGPTANGVRPVAKTELRQTKSTPGYSARAMSGKGKGRLFEDIRGIQSCPTSPSSSPEMRRRSLGVVTTAAWGLRTYRGPTAAENIPNYHRRRSIAAPVVVGDSVRERRKNSLKKKQTKISADELPACMKPHPSEFILEQEKQKNEDENICKGDENCELNSEKEATERKNHTMFDDEEEEFRQRLRSRSVEDDRVMSRRKALEAREVHRRRETRRKSFDAWLSEKKREATQKMSLLTLEKQREAEEEASRRQQRKGKSYEEWLSEKTGEKQETRRQAWGAESRGPESRGAKSDDSERKLIAQARYEKWLMEKETKALEKEWDMLKEAERKTIEMRKKYEEKRKNALNNIKYPTGSLSTACG